MAKLLLHFLMNEGEGRYNVTAVRLPWPLFFRSSDQSKTVTMVKNCPAGVGGG